MSDETDYDKRFRETVGHNFDPPASDETDKATPILSQHPRFERREYPDGRQSIHWVHEHGHTEVATVEVADDERCGEDKTLAEHFVRAVNAFDGLVRACELAEKYLSHPDVQAMPFALSAECAAKRVSAALALAKRKP